MMNLLRAQSVGSTGGRDGGLDQDGRDGGDEKPWDSGCVLKVELAG